MTEQQLVDNGYPRPTSRGGVASINWGVEPPPTIQPVGSNGQYIMLYRMCLYLSISAAMRHRCCRCGKNFIVYSDGQYQTVEDCVHHYGRLFKVRGQHTQQQQQQQQQTKLAEYGEGMVSEYSCCNQRRDSVGCQVAKVSHLKQLNLTPSLPFSLSLQFHVTAGAKPAEVSGYVQTSSSFSRETAFAVDCEMCYTTAGLELTSLSVVDMTLQAVYEAIVLPPRPIVDYNTR